MHTINNNLLKWMKKEYPCGTRIVLVHMANTYEGLRVGDRGTVRFTDDVGNIIVDWDGGYSTVIDYEADIVRKLTGEELKQKEGA